MTYGRPGDYYRLAKPGIVYGNDIAFIAGYAAGWTIGGSWLGLFGSLAGISFIMASSCVVNNIYDRDIDASMRRTASRELVMRRMPVHAASWYAGGLLIVGTIMMNVFGGWGATLTSLLGWILYGLVYTYAKHRTPHATLIGTVPGSLPMVVGYLAAGSGIDLLITSLFVAMAGWQMVHFYAIAMYRQSDYRGAGVPTYVAVRGVTRTISAMRWYGVLYAVAALAAGMWLPVIYSIATIVIAGWFLWQLWTTPTDQTVWARHVFRSSLIVLLVWSLTIVGAAVL